MTGWWKAPDSILTGVATWKDSSGNSRNLTPTGTALVTPSAALPYYTLNGSTDKFVGVAASNFFPTTNEGTCFMAFNPSAVVGVSASYLTDDAVFGVDTAGAGNDIGYFLRKNGSIYETASLWFDSSARYAVQTPAPLNIGGWNVAIWGHHATGSLTYNFLNDPINFVSTGGSGAAGMTHNFNIGYGTLATHFTGFIGEVIVFSTWLADNDRATVFNYLAARWYGRGDVLEQMRDLGTRRTWMLGRPRMHMLLNDISLATPIPTNPLSDSQETFVSHPRGLAVDGSGWGERLDWQPRPGRIEEYTQDFDKLTRTLKAADLRPYRHSLIDSGKVALAGPRREGTMLGAAGMLRLFTRDSPGYYLDPGDGYTIVKAVTDQEQSSQYGMILGPSRTNQMLRSSFVSGLTGLGAVVGTGTVALDTTTLVFDPSITPNSLKYTYGGTDLYRTWPITTGLAFGSASGTQNLFLYQTVSAPGEYLQVQIQRSVDSLWLQSNGSWGAAAQWFPAAAPAPEDPKLTVFQIDFGVSATNITVRIGFPSGGTSGRTANLYHVECCLGGGWVPLGGLFVVTDAAAASAAEDQLLIRLLQATGPLGPATFLDAQTIAFKYSVASFGVNVPEIHIGAQDSVLATDGWAFNVPAHPYGFSARTGGATVTAVGPTPSYVGGTTLSDHRVVLRRISSHGDLGLAAGTLDVWVDGAKGTTAVEGSAPSPGDYKTFWTRGGGANNLNASIINSLVASPYAWPDLECAAWGL